MRSRSAEKSSEGRATEVARGGEVFGDSPEEWVEDTARPGSEMIFGFGVRVPFGVEKVVECAPGGGRKEVIGAHNPVEQAAGVLGAAAGFGVIDSQANVSVSAQKSEG